MPFYDANHYDGAAGSPLPPRDMTPALPSLDRENDPGVDERPERICDYCGLTPHRVPSQCPWFLE